MAEKMIRKILPCLITDTFALTEWLDAMSLQGCLLTYDSMHYFHADFVKTDDNKRYYHMLIPTIKTVSRGLIKDEDYSVTSQTIQEYKDSGMEYVGEKGGILFFRTDRLDVIRSCNYANDYASVTKSMQVKIITIILTLGTSLVVVHERLSKTDNTLSILSYVLFALISILNGWQIIDVIRDYLKIKHEGMPIPVYLKDVKVQSPVSNILFLCVFLLLIILLLLPVQQ